MQSFLDALRTRVLVCDGAMGTMLYGKGVFLNKCFDALNVSQPDLVAEVHLEYARTGADVLETNTFGANRIKLGAFGLADKLRAINVQGARIARHAARERCYVAGAIGPLGIRIAPWGKLSADEAQAYFREQAEALAEGGVDLFILETFRDLNEIGAAIAAVRSVCALPIVAQMTTEEDGASLDGTPPERFAPELERLGADVIGVNCGVGPAPMLETIERIARVTSRHLSAQANAGSPREVEGRTIYLSSPEYMASYARRFITRRVRLVGGCCGTTPEHIRLIAKAVRAAAPVAEVGSAAGPRAVTVSVPETPPVAREEKSRLAHSLARRKFVVLVELLPPRGHQPERTVDAAKALKIRGADAINIPDGPSASGRMSALSLAVLIEQQAGIETVLHYACRDRTLLGMQSDLLGAHAMGVRNVLVVTGDPPTLGDYPRATGVFDVDSIGLANLVSRLNRGIDIGGQAIGRPSAFHVGVAVNPTALDMDLEVRRFEQKVEAGAEFAVTNWTFDLRALDACLRRIERAGIPIVAGLWPFESVLNAEFMANEVPGVTVPAALVDRMRQAESPQEAAAEGMAIAGELAAAIKDRVQGIQIGTVAGRIEPALAVMDALA